MGRSGSSNQTLVLASFTPDRPPDDLVLMAPPIRSKGVIDRWRQSVLKMRKDHDDEAARSSFLLRQSRFLIYYPAKIKATRNQVVQSGHLQNTRGSEHHAGLRGLGNQDGEPGRRTRTENQDGEPAQTRSIPSVLTFQLKYLNVPESRPDSHDEGVASRL